MKLKNDFPNAVRNLFMYSTRCWICDSNGNGRGGLQLHHIWGRISNSALNAAPLCGECHSHVGHTFEEREDLFKKTMAYLIATQYSLTVGDLLFMEKVGSDIIKMKLQL